MPMNNATQITEAERALIKRWYEAGAPDAADRHAAQARANDRKRREA